MQLENVPKKKLNKQQALLKAANYCAYQERCHSEVAEKLKEWGLTYGEAQEVIVQLIEQNYLNEERFAIAFAGGKFRIKNWGKQRITRELKLRNVSTYCINKAIESIEQIDYDSRMKSLIHKKWGQTKASSLFEKRKKVAMYAISKGFEGDLVWEVINQLADD
ncbi:MAG: RecX family transcriptional regulator [Bacteroidia bacterium]|jgi:regulatory protein|nr:RecX family transcriptional regulator [Bacteroidia bacterium]